MVNTAAHGSPAAWTEVQLGGYTARRIRAGRTTPADAIIEWPPPPPSAPKNTVVGRKPYPRASAPQRADAHLHHASASIVGSCTESICHLDQYLPPPLQVMFNPQGTRLLTASADHTCKVWSVQSGGVGGGDAGAGGGCVQALRGHTDEVFSMALNYEGDTLVTSSKDNTCRVWRADAGSARTD